MEIKSAAEQLFYTTVRILNCQNGEAVSSGTGFIYNHILNDTDCRCIVTNKHVIENADDLIIFFHTCDEEGNLLPQKYRCKVEGNVRQIFHGHPDDSIDVAVIPLLPLENEIKNSHNINIFYKAFNSELIPSSEQILQLDAIEPITFIGYPNGIWDSVNLLPIVRQGITSTPITVDYENKPIFLIDASVFGGSSGSPVLIFNQSSYSSKEGLFALAPRLLFVGVVSAVFKRDQLNEIISVPVPTEFQPMAKQTEMIDLGIVYKSSTVAETVESLLRSKGVAF